MHVLMAVIQSAKHSISSCGLRRSVRSDFVESERAMQRKGLGPCMQNGRFKSNVIEGCF